MHLYYKYNVSIPTKTIYHAILISYHNNRYYNRSLYLKNYTNDSLQFLKKKPDFVMLSICIYSVKTIYLEITRV